MRTVSIILLSLFLFSCNPFITKETRKQRRAERLVNKAVKMNPSLLEKDTIIQTIEIKVPEITVDTIVRVNTDLSGLDSLLASLSLSGTNTREIIRYVRERPILTDTARYSIDGLEIKVYQEGDYLRLHVYKPEETLSETVETITQTVKNIKLSAWERFTRGLNGLTGFILTALIILLIASYVLRKIRGGGRLS